MGAKRIVSWEQNQLESLGKKKWAEQINRSLQRPWQNMKRDLADARLGNSTHRRLAHKLEQEIKTSHNLLRRPARIWNATKNQTGILWWKRITSRRTDPEVTAEQLTATRTGGSDQTTQPENKTRNQAHWTEEPTAAENETMVPDLLWE
jgi:hypothetical protein